MSPRWRTALACLGSLVLLACVGATWTVLHAFEDICASRVIEEIRSPDGQMRAVLFTRDCGATAVVSVHVSVIPVNHALENEGGNLFIAITDGTPMPQVRWLDNVQIEISYHPGARVFRAESGTIAAAARYKQL
jgi:hypothetical protein